MNQIIGSIIAEERNKKGYSQNKLAKLSGLSRMSIVRYEKGERSPDMEALDNIAKALGLSPAYFIAMAYDYGDIDESLLDSLQKVDPDAANMIRTDIELEERVTRSNRIFDQLNYNGMELWLSIGELLLENPNLANKESSKNGK